MESLELLRDHDPDIKNLAREEIDRLEAEKTRLEKQLTQLLIPKDPLDQKNVLLEIRAGTGGDEAGLFAGDLYKMYSRYAEGRNWKIEVMDLHATGVGRTERSRRLDQGPGRLQPLQI